VDVECCCSFRWICQKLWKNYIDSGNKTVPFFMLSVPVNYDNAVVDDYNSNNNNNNNNGGTR
jgi:hypothetical protein